MAEHRREPDADAGEYVVKVRRKKKRKDSKSELRRAAYKKIGRDWNLIDIIKRVAAFLLVVLIFAGFVYYLLLPPSSGGN